MGHKWLRRGRFKISVQKIIDKSPSNTFCSKIWNLHDRGSVRESSQDGTFLKCWFILEKQMIFYFLSFLSKRKISFSVSQTVLKPAMLIFIPENRWSLKIGNRVVEFWAAFCTLSSGLGIFESFCAWYIWFISQKSPESNIYHVISHYTEALLKAFWADYSFAVLSYESGQWIRESGASGKQFWTICVAEQNQMPNMFDWQVYENTEQPLFAATVVTSAIIFFVGAINWIVIQGLDPRISFKNKNDSLRTDLITFVFVDSWIKLTLE